MRVLMVGPSRKVHGGISGVINNYYKAGLDQQIDLTYIGTMEEGTKLHKLKVALTAYIRFLVKVSKCDIVHVNMAAFASYYRKLYFIYLAKLFHKKLIIHQHGGDFASFYYKNMSLKAQARTRKNLNKADLFLVLAPPWKRFFSELIPENKIIVFPDAIEIPESFQKDYTNHNILFLGRLCVEKGIRELLWAIGEISKTYSDVHLYLGGIWENPELQVLSEADEKHITWLGWLSGDEKWEYLQKCSIMVLPSYFEGQSVSLLEGMTAYCTCVASDTGGIPEMIQDGVTGVLVEAKDGESLKEGLIRALGKETFREKMGKNARIKVEKDFEILENMDRLLGFYNQVIGAN